MNNDHKITEITIKNIRGFKEKTQLGIDVTQELLSDPLNWASALLIPWTGGTSIAAKAAGGEAAKQTFVVSKFAAGTCLQSYVLLPWKVKKLSERAQKNTCCPPHTSWVTRYQQSSLELFVIEAFQAKSTWTDMMHWFPARI